MGSRLLYLDATPLEAHRIVRDRRLPAGERIALVGLRSGCPGGAAVGIRVDEGVVVRETDAGHFSAPRAAAEAGIERAYQPWHVDVTRDPGERWRTYMDDHFGLTLRNHFGAVTPGSLRQAEDDIVEAMFIGLRAEPVEQSLDLSHLRAVHARLFDQVYPWAGELRTVNMERPDGPRFVDWDEIELRWSVLSEHVRAQGHLRGLDSSQFAHEAATVYNEVNTIHAFREGNGRSQRVWMSDLASAAGHSIDWKLAAGRTNDLASALAREGNIGPLREMMQAIVEKRDAATASERAGSAEINAAAKATPRPEPSLPSNAAIVAQSMFGAPPSGAVSRTAETHEKAGLRRSDLPASGLERD